MFYIMKFFPEKFEEIFSYETLYDIINHLNNFWFDYYNNDLDKYKLVEENKNINLYSYSEFLNIE